MKTVGLEQQDLAIRVLWRGRFSGTPAEVVKEMTLSADYRKLTMPDLPTASRPHTVRLHFAELNTVQPQERRFAILAAERTGVLDRQFSICFMFLFWFFIAACFTDILFRSLLRFTHQTFLALWTFLAEDPGLRLSFARCKLSF